VSGNAPIHSLSGALVTPPANPKKNGPLAGSKRAAAIVDRPNDQPFIIFSIVF
jgi:hypothetical protein